MNLGYFLLYSALAAQVIDAVSSVKLRQIKIARAINVVSTSLMVALFLSFTSSFLGDDFSISQVVRFSDVGLSPLVKLSGVLVSPSGSLLFLTMIASITFLVVRTVHGETLTPRTLALLAFFSTFFLILALSSDPFQPSGTAVVKGHGLNPILRGSFSLMHQLLFFTAIAVAVAALALSLLQRREDRALARPVISLAWVLFGASLMCWILLKHGPLGVYWEGSQADVAVLLPWIASTACVYANAVKPELARLRVFCASTSLAMAFVALTVVRDGTAIPTLGYPSYVNDSLITLAISTFAFALISLMYLPKGRARERRLFSSRNLSMVIVACMLLSIASCTVGLIYPKLFGVTLKPIYYKQSCYPFLVAMVFSLLAMASQDYLDDKRVKSLLALSFGAGLVSVIAPIPFIPTTADALANFILPPAIIASLVFTYSIFETSRRKLLKTPLSTLRKVSGRLLNVGLLLVLVGFLLSSTSLITTGDFYLSVGEVFAPESPWEWVGAHTYLESIRLVWMSGELKEEVISIGGRPFTWVSPEYYQAKLRITVITGAPVGSGFIDYLKEPGWGTSFNPYVYRGLDKEVHVCATSVNFTEDGEPIGAMLRISVSHYPSLMWIGSFLLISSVVIEVAPSEKIQRKFRWR